MVTLLVAIFACRMIAVGNLEGALWRLSMLMAIANPIDLVREYVEGNTTGWRVATRLGGAAICHVLLSLALFVIGLVFFGRSYRTRSRKQRIVIAVLGIVAAGVAIWLVSTVRSGSLVDPARARTW